MDHASRTLHLAHANSDRRGRFFRFIVAYEETGQAIGQRDMLVDALVAQGDLHHGSTNKTQMPIGSVVFFVSCASCLTGRNLLLS